MIQIWGFWECFMFPNAIMNAWNGRGFLTRFILYSFPMQFLSGFSDMHEFIKLVEGKKVIWNLSDKEVKNEFEV